MRATWPLIASTIVSAFALGCQQGETKAAAKEGAEASVGVERVDRGIVEETLTTYGKVEFAEEAQRAVTFVRPGQVLAAVGRNGFRHSSRS